MTPPIKRGTARHFGLRKPSFGGILDDPLALAMWRMAKSMDRGWMSLAEVRATMHRDCGR